MNVHDSEKVVGTLIPEGYRQVQTVEEADLILYNTCSIRDKAEQKVFNRLNDYKKLQEAGQEVSACSAASPSRKAKRFSSARPTCRWWPARRRTATCRRCWCRSKQGTRASPDSTTARPTSASRPNSPRAPIRIADTSPSSKAATSSAPTAWFPSPAAKSAAAPPSRCWPKRARWPISATPKFSCSGRT